ncbi:ATP-binding cassette domain-containing protein [Tateyamaria armeniaca]|uniref:ATP-binding cassette domain-containing protein n=1 Tax=Tateyamaria armeniaca TaxID=2518930 RepID=A0ABW8UPD3_9RHOB
MVDNLFPLEVTDLTIKRRGKTLLGPVNHTFEGTGLTMVIGPNGAGKTTLLKALHGIERISSGDVTWSAADAIVRARQAYVFQTPTMLRRSVRDNLAYPLKLVGTPRAEIEAQCKAWAAHIGLTDALDRPAPRLSGGERQKLALARALIRRPEVLFLDEPCANLDGQATSEIEALLLNALQQGTRIIMTSHNVGQIKRLASDIVFLLYGQAHEVGDAERLDQPETPELAAFLKGDIIR